MLLCSGVGGVGGEVSMRTYNPWKKRALELDSTSVQDGRRRRRRRRRRREYARGCCPSDPTIKRSG